MLKSNVVAAAIVGLILGVVAELFFAFFDRIPVLGCLITPMALFFGLALPVIIGALAAAWGSSRGLLTAPHGAVDGGLASFLAELVSRVFGLCATLVASRSEFLAPRFLLPTLGPATRALYYGVWEIGWFILSLILAGLLGALGGFAYAAFWKK